MAAFVAKQMVGNKLNAVKGEHFLRNRFQVITPRSENFPVAPCPIFTSNYQL